VLTEKLRIITRIIEVGDNDQLAEDITFRSNNQNGINLRDLKSNDRVQTALQKQFRTRFGGSVEYAIKAGDEQPAAEVIRNDRAGQWLMALYLCEPYNAHQKYKIFGPDYERIFGRDVTAERIYLCSLASAAVDSASSAIEDEAIRGYQLTKLILMGAVGDRLRSDTTGRSLLDHPEGYIPRQSDAVRNALSKFAALLIPDFNFYIREKKEQSEGGYYDYKNGFKSADEYQSLSRSLKRDYDKAILKSQDERFANISSKESLSSVADTAKIRR